MLATIGSFLLGALTATAMTVLGFFLIPASLFWLFPSLFLATNDTRIGIMLLNYFFLLASSAVIIKYSWGRAPLFLKGFLFTAIPLFILGFLFAFYGR